MISKTAKLVTIFVTEIHRSWCKTGKNSRVEYYGYNGVMKSNVYSWNVKPGVDGVVEEVVVEAPPVTDLACCAEQPVHQPRMGVHRARFVPAGETPGSTIDGE